VGAEDLRVDCDLGDGAAVARLRIPVVRGIPARIGLRVWPTELRTDFPFAEVRVVLEDHRGDRIDASDVQIWAEHGSISLEAGGGNEVEGEYDGSEATDQAVDVVRATYTPTPGDGVIEVVTLAWEPVPVAGRAQVQARVLDHRLRPLVSVPVELDAGAEVEVLTTDERGVATGQVRLPEGRGPVELRAQAGVREARAVAIRGGAGRPLTEQGLSSQADLVLSPGRVAGLSIEVEPGVLRAAPGATAWVYVTLEDRSGNPITDEEVSLTASEGWIGPMRVRSDGSWIAEYVPMPAERPREVEITAETETLRTSAHLEVAPRVVRVSVGPSGGVISNLRGITAPLLTIDSDLRLRNRLVGEALMVRVGAARYAFRGLVTTGLGAPARLDNTVYAFTVGALFRRDRGRFGVWGGGGLVAAVQDLDLWFGNEQVSQGFRVAAGPAGIGGVGGRALGGELLVNGQASWLPTSGGEAGFTGNVGGFAIGAGYRLVF